MSDSPLATTVDIDRWRNATADQLGARLQALYGPALGRLPNGRQIFHGLPFDLGPPSPATRWALLDQPITIDLGHPGPASHLVIAHLCDTWRDEAGVRPAGLAVGHVVPVGEVLAKYTIVDRAGRNTERVIRRRFEVNDGILGWGSGAFAAIAHLDNEVLDWRGPHGIQEPGRYAPTGQSGSLTTMPGTYGTSQTGMTDFVPSATDDALIWLHAIELDTAAEPVALRLEPLSNGRPGSDVLIAAISVFRGSSNPLARSPRFQVRIGGLSGGAARVDLGTIIRTRPAPDSAPPGPVIGWGSERDRPDDRRADHRDSDVIVDMAMAPDGVLSLGDWTIAGRDLLAGKPAIDPAG
ncbi:MAG: hypothetical protein ACRDGI_03825, partial [Candidatus Limnocylindrales bacterium]